MPYIGKSPVGGGFHKLDALTASATDTYALTLGSAAYFPETANQLLVSLNGVIQAPQDSFTVSGSNLIFDTALTSSDSIDFVVALGDVLSVGSVTDGAVTANKIGNGAVTKAKMGTTELDLATIKDSTGTNTAMTIDSSGYVNMPNTAEIDIWYLTSNISVSGSTTNVISGLARWATNWEKVGTGMTESSGVFTFPSTGKWKAFAKLYGSSSSTANYMGLQATLSTDSGSSFSVLGYAYQAATSSEYFDTTFPFYIDVTDASTHKVKFNYQTHGSASIGGHGSELRTFFIFEKLAST